MNLDLIPGPVAGTRITEAYARMVTRDAYFWTWPMLNIYNKRLAFAHATEPGRMGGVMPVAPLNRLSMLTDCIDPLERLVACPNLDVVYGRGVLALDQSPVVIQVPDFGKRFWVYQVVDLRTDSFADLGVMYDTAPGFYLAVGPNWKGKVPPGISKVFRASTSTGLVGPRVFLDDSVEDRQAVQEVLGGIDMYPLAEYDGTMKRRDWRETPSFRAMAGALRKGESHWVFPQKFVYQLPFVLRDAPPLLGEEARYAEVLAVVAAAKKDPVLKAVIVDEAAKTEKDVVRPLLQFRNFGIPLPHHWTTANNGAAFGTDYFTRTAIAKSNIFVNKSNETKYFYQDLDAGGLRLNSRKNYTIRFSRGELPPVKGFWSLSMYNAEHFFVPNSIKRHSIGSKTKDLETLPDGSITIYLQTDEPADLVRRKNWLPSPRGQDFSLFLRAYWPDSPITNGQWTPPGVEVA